MRVIHLAELVVLAAIWGASFLFMRTATPEFGAIALVAVRTGIALVILLPFLLMARQFPAVLEHWRVILVVGLINTAIPFCLFSYGTMHLGAGFGAILNATAPMFGALVAFLWLKDKLSFSAVTGLFVGFAGVSVLTAARTGISLDAALLPVLASLCATFLYGLAACYTKRYLGGVNTLAIATGSQAFAALALAPLAVVFWPETAPSSQAWWQAIVLGVLCTALAYILYFRLIANVGAARAISVAYLIPVFGVFWGMVFIQEVITTTMILGAALILLGVAMTTGVIKLPKRAFAS